MQKSANTGRVTTGSRGDGTPVNKSEGRLHPQLTARSLPARFSAKYFIYYNFFTRLSASIYNDVYLSTNIYKYAFIREVFLKSLNIFPFVYDSCLPCNHIEKVDSFIRLSFAVPSSWALLRRQYISLILYKQRKRCEVLIFNMKLRMLRSFLRVWIIWITYVDLLIHDG